MKKTIKVINLLNKIANVEEVPNKIKYKERVYEYYCLNYYLEGKSLIGLHSLFYELSYNNFLNDEVEILEEDEKPKEIEEFRLDKDIIIIDENTNLNLVSSVIKTEEKINEIIGTLNCLLKKEE